MTRTTILAALALTLAACGPAGDDYSSVLPDDRLLVDFSADFGSSSRTSVGEMSEYVVFTADVTNDVNGLIGEVLDAVDEITSFDPTWTDGGTKALWGPWGDDTTEGRLWVEQLEDESYVWAVEGRFTGDGDDGWVAAYVGEVDAGADDIASSGRFAIDFAAAASFDPDHEMTGIFYVEYTVDGEEAAVEAGFDGFSEDGGPVADAGYAYAQDGTGNGSMDLAILVDEYGGPEAELHIVRSRWNAAGEGRADVYLTDGDFGELVYTATECWGVAADVVFYEDNYDFTRNGEVGACAFGDPDFNEDGPATAR